MAKTNGTELNPPVRQTVADNNHGRSSRGVVAESASCRPEPVGATEVGWVARLTGALVESKFRRYTAGTLIWGSAHQLITLAQGYTLFKLTGSTLYLAALGASVGVMSVIMPAIGGFLNDRMPRKRLLLGGSLAMAVVMAAVTAVYATGHLQPWHLLAVGFAQGSFLSLDWTTRQAMLPAVVSRPRLVNAVSVDLAMFNLARIVAPLAGGAVLASWGGPAAYGLIVGLFAASVLLITTLRLETDVQESHPPIWSDIKEIGRLLWSDQMLTVNIMFTAVNALMLGGVIYLLPAFADEVFKTSESGLSWLFTTIGAGSFIAAVALSVWGGVKRAGQVLILSNLLFAACVVGFAYSGQLALAAFCAFALGFFNSIHIALGAAAVQLASPEGMRGRVFGAYEVAWGVFPLGGLIYGIIAHWAGLPAALLIGAGVTALFTIAVWIRAPKIRALMFMR
ncbi:MAG: MFS transporter [Dehalococcoidia bacterium]|nr:MFS transporter [Dehalococcoidia bacterium]MSQ35235.1 MFS transporter [Dehalococcoidia bacterium]